MGRETVLFKSKEKKSAADIATTLRQIADKVEAGSLILKQGGSDVALDFPGQMTLELKVEEEQGRTMTKSLEIELEWAPDAPDTGAEIL